MKLYLLPKTLTENLAEACANKYINFGVEARSLKAMDIPFPSEFFEQERVDGDAKMILTGYPTAYAGTYEKRGQHIGCVVVQSCFGFDGGKENTLYAESCFIDLSEAIPLNSRYEIDWDGKSHVEVIEVNSSAVRVRRIDGPEEILIDTIDFLVESKELL